MPRSLCTSEHVSHVSSDLITQEWKILESSNLANTFQFPHHDTHTCARVTVLGQDVKGPCHRSSQRSRVTRAITMNERRPHRQLSLLWNINAVVINRLDILYDIPKRTSALRVNSLLQNSYLLLLLYYYYYYFCFVFCPPAQSLWA